MFQNRFQLARIFGIPIYIDASWILIFALVTLTLATAYFPQQYRTWSTVATWVIATITSLLFFASVLVHELSHSVTSIALGRPVRSITLFLFGGVAEIESEQIRARDEFLVAIMGPIASVGIGIVSLGIGFLVSNSFIDGIMRYLGTINIALAVFNMIPGFPLDGGRVLRSILWGLTDNLQQASRIASSIGELVAWLFIGVGALMALQGALLNGLWIAFIGWFLLNAARSSYRQLMLQQVLSNVPVQELIRRRTPTISPTVSLAEMVERTLQGGDRAYLVTQDNVVAGIVTLTDLGNVPDRQRTNVTVGDVMTPVSNLHTIDMSASLWDAFERMAKEDIHQLPVLNSRRQTVGMVQRSDLMRYLHLKTEVPDA